MRIALLGPIEVTDGAGLPREVGGARLRALLTLLALDAGRIVTAERLLDGIWGDDRPAGEVNALQSLVSRLRRSLPESVIESYGSGYRLALDPEDIDVHRFERLAEAGRATLRGDPARADTVLAEALALWRGPALVDVAEAEFAQAPIRRLAELRLGVVEDHVEAGLVLGRYAEPIAELEALVAAEPLRERPYGQLMRALYGVGRQADALTVYERVRTALSERLGVDPSPELERTYLGVLHRDLALAAPREAAAPAAEEPWTNLPAPLTSFIGRDADLTTVGTLVVESRLVTLTGAGGAGKTRLATEAARRFAARTPDGTWLVELAPMTDPTEVPSAVMAVLGLREAGTPAHARAGVPASVAVSDPMDRLVSALANKRMLLLFDNCEHLIDAVAEVANRLLAECADVRVLATSREPLGITGETLWPVEPLALPPEDACADEAATYPAVRLFVDRAAAVRPRFGLVDDNVGQVVRICRALDGVPLAIELAAARCRALTPEQLAARLGDRFHLLRAGSRTALPQHRALRAVVEWSWDLLDDSERALWRRMSVFTGGATESAIETVDADESLAAGDVLDVLTRLVDKSLVIVGGADRPRYRMLETIRAYGVERLDEAGEGEEVRHAHAAYFLDLAEVADPELRRRDQLVWLGRLDAEHDNLHAALRWAIETGATDIAFRLCAGLGWYWWSRGQRREASESAAEVLTMPGESPAPARAFVYALRAFGALEGSGGFEQAMAWLAEAQSIVDSVGNESVHPLLRLTLPMLGFFQAGNDEETLWRLAPLFEDRDPWLRAFGHLFYASWAFNLGLPAVGEPHLALALDGLRDVGERWGTSMALAVRAEFAGWRGDHREAVACYEEAAELGRQLGNREEAPQMQARCAYQLWLLGERERAHDTLSMALRAVERVGSPESTAAVHYQLGVIAWREGDIVETRRRLARALELSRAIKGPRQLRALILGTMGGLLTAEGDLAAAAPHHAQALGEAVTTRDHPVIAQVLVGFADLAMRGGDAERATLLLGAGDGLRGTPDLSLPDLARLEAETRAALGDARDDAYRRGHAMTLEQVLDLLDVRPPPPLCLPGRDASTP